jgi:hypothetical protein
MEVTPLIPLTLRGRFMESSYFKGHKDINIWYNGEVK